MYKVSSILLLVWLSLTLNIADATTAQFEAKPIEIIVGMGARPPFFDAYGKTGAGPDILNAMNAVQNKFIFRYKNVPPLRKNQAVSEQWIDISMWDNLKWGWSQDNVKQSLALIRSQDVYIASASSKENRAFFNDFTSKKIVLVSGYHYNFLNKERDINKINKTYNAVVVRTEEAAINMLLAKRAEIAVVSTSSLSWFALKNHQSKNIFNIADKVDSEYTRHFIIPNSAPINVEELNEIMMLIYKKGLLNKVYRKYNLTDKEEHEYFINIQK